MRLGTSALPNRSNKLACGRIHKVDPAGTLRTSPFHKCSRLTPLGCKALNVAASRAVVDEGWHGDLIFRSQPEAMACGTLLLIRSGLPGASTEEYLGMCDFSLQSARSRPAKIGDKLTTRNFGTGARGFAAPEDPTAAVCLFLEQSSPSPKR